MVPCYPENMTTKGEPDDSHEFLMEFLASRYESDDNCKDLEVVCQDGSLKLHLIVVELCYGNRFTKGKSL